MECLGAPQYGCFRKPEGTWENACKKNWWKHLGMGTNLEESENKPASDPGKEIVGNWEISKRN